jgi:tetratricopeptide (TPR) repeat protein
MARKQYRDAIDAYESWSKKEPRNAVAWNKVGIAYHQLMQLGKARTCYERAIRLRKNYAEAINNVGTVYYAEKNYKKAIRYYERALKITPDSASVYSNLGTAWFGRKKYDEALAAYQTALKLDPEVFEHRNAVGVLLQERSVADRARFHYFLAKTYAGAGNKEKAIEYLRKALEEGFSEMKQVMQDQAFAELIKTPEFTELMTNPPAAIPR